MNIGAIVLAAGSSRRFNGDKRRSMLESGKSLLVTSIENTTSHFSQILVVLRATDHDYAEELRNAINDPKVTFFCAPDSAIGMAHSLANALSTVDRWQAAAIFLGDMPYLKAETINILLKTYEDNAESQPIVVPVVASSYGHPVIFDQAYFDAISALEGDVGAKAVIKKHIDRVIEVAVDDDGVVKDIDRPTDSAST
jgi:molybdenum cofactor cytidylyltransferase